MFFLSDGQPTEKETKSQEWLAELRDPAFNERPNIRRSASVILRLFARSHDSRLLTPYVRHVSAQVRDLLARSLCPDAANRPLAGEWQLARRHLLAAGGLNERYPGPAPAPILTSHARLDPAPSRYRRRGTPPGGRARQGTPGHGDTQHSVSLAWLAIAGVVFALILAWL